jgi:alternate signal-mediated exported protein
MGWFSMNRLTKGLIAVSAGTVLLLGGAGSLALWNDAANVDAGDVSSGVLTLDATPGAWAPDLTLWVPGDSAVYTTDVSIVAQGDNIAAQLSIDPASVTGDPDLLAALEITMAVGTPTGGTFTPVAGQTNVFDVAPTDPLSGTPITAPVTVTVNFPADSVTDLVAQGETVNLTGLQLLLQQIAP